MRRVQGQRLSSAEKADLWARWRRGESPMDIARALERGYLAVRGVVAAVGGIPPAARRRSRLALTVAEREEISRGLAHGGTLRHLGRALGRAPSTISREVRRHGGRHGYRAAVADVRAWARSRRPKSCRFATRPALRDAVAAKLILNWSPQQIAGWLRRAFPDNPEMHVSHETIYRSLFVQSRGVLKKTLIAHLRRPRAFRRSQRATLKGRGHGQIVDAVSIRERPAEVADRAVPGHWEGDLLRGAAQSYIATLVERQSRYVMLIRLEGHDTRTVVRALTQRVQRLPRGLMASLTWDRGPELAAHKAFSIATNVQVYFCDPSSPWQRGSNENTNGLLRQYFPKGTPLGQFTQAKLDAIANQLNTRPRKTLGYQTPAEKLAEIVAATD
jgi:IS30 family transposase